MKSKLTADTSELYRKTSVKSKKPAIEQRLRLDDENMTSPSISAYLGDESQFMRPRLQRRAMTPAARRDYRIPSYMQPTFNTNPMTMLGARKKDKRSKSRKKAWTGVVSNTPSLKSRKTTHRIEIDITPALSFLHADSRENME